MTYSLLRTTAVSLAAISLTACMSGSNSPWTPEFGQVQAPHSQQTAYGQSQYQYAQYPMPNSQGPNSQGYDEAEMINGYLATLGLAGSQYLSPLPNSYSQQTTAHTQGSQNSTWNGQQQQYNSQYAPSTSTYQQPTQMRNTQPYQSQTQKSYQSPYAPSTPRVSASTSMQSTTTATTPYSSYQPKTYGNAKPTSGTAQRSTYGQAMNAPMTTVQQPAYGQSMKAPMTPQRNMGQQQPMYGTQMASPQNPYGRNISAPMAHSSAAMMQQQTPQSNMIPWGQAMAWMYQGQVKSVMQSHKGTVTMVLHNGQTAETQSPQIDDVLRLKQDCGAVCQNMTVATE